MGKYILSVYAGHNASALIGDERGILFAVQEERLAREKNYWGFPAAAIRHCMKAVGASPSDIGSVVYGSRQVISRYHSRDDVLHAYRRQETAVGRLRQRVVMPLMLATAPNLGQGGLREALAAQGLQDRKLSFFGHHESHADAAYFGLRADPSRPYLVMTCDGAGDGVCATVAVMQDGRREEISRTPWANSLGALYSWVTFLLGFVPLEHEYKLMGMAPYCSPAAAEAIESVFASYLRLDEENLRFKSTSRRTNDLRSQLIRDLQGKRFDHVCAGLQRFTERMLVRWVELAVERTGVKDVLASGGVFMNVKANKAIAELPSVRSFQAFPSCGDETLPMGAFYREYAEQHGQAHVPRLSNFYLGDEVEPDSDEIERIGTGLDIDQPSQPEARVAALLTRGEPVARCAGRMEFGARALGNRSILADPADGDIVRVINQMVKKRDFWMPFAPVVRDTRQCDYIVNPKGLESPYMMMTFDTTDRYREMIAAVHNADLTCRAQLTNAALNPQLDAIMGHFETKTGRGALLNTSFNLHGFPIVRSASEAVDVLRRSGLRYLQVGPYILSKRGEA
jgi:carbamoyltransferase